MRVVIVGPPKSGKTTLSNQFDGVVLHTDDTIGMHDWSEGSEEVMRWMQGDYDVIEGVAAARALRKFLNTFPDESPCDKVILMTNPRQQLSRGQATMAKAVETVMLEIIPELVRRGVEFEIR